MATHFQKFKGLKINMRHNNMTQKYLEKMIVRQPQSKIDNLHPDAKMKMNIMTQAPLPLKYKLHELTSQSEGINIPLGTLEPLPFEVI